MADHRSSFTGRLSRRRMLGTSIGGLGLSLPSFLRLRNEAAAASIPPSSPGKAKSCIVLYCRGGMSHHETFDPKPDAPAEVRGEFQPIATSVPGIFVGEHIPKLAAQMDKLAVIRSVHHDSSAHGKGMYWNLTGHAPPQPTAAVNLPPSRDDWPSLAAMLTDFGRTPKVNGNAGRDHYPSVYSLFLAGGGILGGQVYGSSDAHGAFPRTDACTPADVHATIFRASGISPKALIHDSLDRPFPVSSGRVLPLL